MVSGVYVRQSGRSRNFSSNEGRGFTDDSWCLNRRLFVVMFFAATCEDNGDKDSEVNNGSEPVGLEE